MTSSWQNNIAFAQAFRRRLHQHPELSWQEHNTAAAIRAALDEAGIPWRPCADTGTVAWINPEGARPAIALRGDIDALPIHEETGKEWQSQSAGLMHACGHDGHTAALLATARWLKAHESELDQAVVLLFQPAEEGGGGGNEMVKEGMMERFGIDEVYGLHNSPGTDVNHIEARTGPLMAAADFFEIEIIGKGAHAAHPDHGIDPIIVGTDLVQAFQRIVSRNVDPLKSIVVSVTTFHCGTADNVIEQTAKLSGTVRTLDMDVRDFAEKRMQEICNGIAQLHGAKINLNYQKEYPVTINHPEQTKFALDVAKKVVGEDRVKDDIEPVMGAEDFSFMLLARPGAYVFLGQGDTPNCHHPEYDFNDEIIPTGSSFMVKLIEEGMPLS